MLKKRPTRAALSPIGPVIDKVLRQCQPISDPALLRVWDVWDKAVGSSVAANARPVALKGNMLLVHVSSSSWLHHLHFLEKEMLNQVNSALGGEKVHTIKLKIGSF